MDSAPSAHAHENAPYAGLTPDCILDALQAHGWRGDGRMLALNSYENRVYQVWLEDGEVVVAKFYRPKRWTEAQILEEHAFAAECLADEVPVVAPLMRAGTTLFHHQGFGFAVYPRRGGRAPELDAPDVLERLGLFIGRLHRVGRRKPFLTRRTLDVAGFGDGPFASLKAGGLIPESLQPAWESIATQALDAVRETFARTGRTEVLRLHGDCHIGNVLWTDAGPHFVDLDDACMGPAVQDLWMLLSEDREACTAQLGRLLSGYRQFMRFDRAELGLIEALRTLRLLHYSDWIARRWDDPAFPAAFPWFGTPRYWQDRILELREQVGALSEDPLSAD